MAKPLKAPLESWQLIATALSQDKTRGPLDLTPISGNLLFSLLHHHGVAALLHHRLQQGYVVGVGSETRALLREQAHHDAAQHLAQTDSLQRLDALLAQQKFPGLILKGAALSLLGITVGRLRPRCDMDIWIHPEQAATLAMLLTEAGYTLANFDPGHRSRKQFQAYRERFDRQPLWFDVHYRLSNRGLFSSALDFQTCLQRAPQLPGYFLRPLAQEDLLLHLCLHLFAHGRGREQDRLLWLYDIHLAYLQLDQAGRIAFRQLALTQGFGALCAQALRRCKMAFATAVSPQELHTLEARREQEPSAALLTASPWRWVWSDLKTQNGLGRKWQFLRELLGNQLAP